MPDRFNHNLNWELLYKEDGVWLRYKREDGTETLLNLGPKEKVFSYLDDEMASFGWEG